MKNNKGQTLVIFVVFLPLAIILMATIVDISLMYYNKNKLDNLNMMVIEYGIDNIKSEDLTSKLESLIVKNDKKIISKNIEIEDNRIKIKLEKNIDSTFGKVIGIEKYEIKSYYIGTNKENKKEIKKG